MTLQNIILKRLTFSSNALMNVFRRCRAHLYSLLNVIVAVHVLHAEMYYEGENEAAISRRCHPAISSCFPSQLEWARLESKMTGTLVWPDDSLNYTTYNFQNNLGVLT